MTTFKVERIGDAPHDMRLLVDGHELHSVARYSIEHDVEDATPVVRLTLAAVTFDVVEQDVRLLVDAGAEFVHEPHGDVRIVERDGMRTLERFSTAVDAALGRDGVINAHTLSEQYLALPPRVRWSLCCALGIISNDEQTEALLDEHRAGATLDASIFARALRSQKLRALRDSITSTHAELTRFAPPEQWSAFDPVNGSDDEQHDEPRPSGAGKYALARDDVRVINQAAAHLDGVLALSLDMQRAIARKLYEIAGNPMPADAIAERDALDGRAPTSGGAVEPPHYLT